MALEGRIRSSVDTALGELTARLDEDVCAIIQQLVTAAREERDDLPRFWVPSAARPTPAGGSEPA